MVKQGKFASTTKQMQGQTNRYKAMSGQGKINAEEVSEYLMVRYHLTRGKKQSTLIENTLIRVLDVLVPTIQANSGALDESLAEHLKSVSMTVPWQYYKVMNDEWAPLQRWLKKELPAVPLTETLRVTTEVEPVDELIAQQLAINWWLNQSQGNTQRLAAVTEEKITSLVETFTPNGKLDWQIVQTIYSTIVFNANATLDVETQNWLKELSEL